MRATIHMSEHLQRWLLGAPAAPLPRPIQLTNQVCFVDAVASVVFVPVLLALGLPAAGLLMLAVLLGYLGLISLNRRGHARFARVGNLALTNLTILVFSIWLGPDTGTRYFFLTAALPTFLLLDYRTERRQIAFWALLPMALLWTELWLGTHWDVAALAPEAQRTLSLAVYPVIVLLMMAHVQLLVQTMLTRELELEEANRRLQEAMRARDEFLSMVSHDLRTPLTVIGGAASVLGSEMLGPVPPKHRDLAEMIQKASDRLGRMISDLLDASSLQAGKVSFQLSNLDLRDLLLDALEDFRAEYERKGLTLSGHLPDVPLPVRIDPDRLRQVLDNLLTNAAKFTPAGGAVALNASRTAEGIRLEVTDSGVGIPESSLERVFETFYRVDGASQRRAKGTGLGLAICRMIVQEHRGRIWAERMPERGTRFVVTLPAVPIPAWLPVEETREPSAPVRCLGEASVVE